jgi:Family of unknown function (DUF6014)
MTQVRYFDQEINMAHKVVKAIQHHQLSEATKILQELGEGQRFPKTWIQGTEYALKTGDWSALSEAFLQGDFVGIDGYFLFVAPHKLSREAGEVVELSAILGQVIPMIGMPSQQVEEYALNIFGTLYQPITEIIPFYCICACGHFGHENTEAFIVPESWVIPGSTNGPALNNMTQHRQRFDVPVQKNIPRIFESETAHLLLNSLSDRAVGVQRQHIEYQYHDAGHATGLGIRRKVNENLLLTYWCGGVEEWRSDGVEFELAARTLDMEEVGKLVAANLCLRIGVDAQRWGGGDFDTHATSGLLTLEYLFRSGILCIKKHQLAFRNPTYKNLAWAVEMQRADAVRLTREEMALENPVGLTGRYQSIGVHQATRQIFQEFVVIPSSVSHDERFDQKLDVA